MAVRKVAIFIHDSLGLGVGNLGLVPAADFARWTGESYPSTDPQDVDIPDVEVLTPNLPYGNTTKVAVASSTASSVTVASATFDAGTGDDHQWVYIREGTGQSQRRAISSTASSTEASVAPNWTTQPDTTSVLEFWTDSYSSSGASTSDTVANTTTLAKDSASKPDFTSNDVGKWLVVGDSAEAAGQ